MESVVVILFILIHAIPFSHANSTSLTAKFGEPCNKALLCNTKGFLHCVSHVCQCAKPENMVYDELQGVCIALPGDTCKFEGMETKRGEKFPEISECDKNSHCGEDGVCVCDDEFILSGNRSCIPNRLFGEECTTDESGSHNCRPDKYLSCIDNQCGCDKGHSIYDEDREECVAIEGSSCVGYGGCVPNANCAFKHTGSYYSSTLCACLPGFSRSPTGLCLANFGQQCNTKDKRCGVDMICKAGICECKYAERQKYDRELNRCVSFVESPCLIKFKMEDGTKANISFPCVKNAECKQIENLYECKCKEGYIEGDDTCDLAYDQPCQEGAEEPCDRLAPLYCVDGKCKCASEYMYYDNSARKCKGLIGAPCLLDSREFCTGGSECRMTRNAHSKYGQCRCNPGYLTTGSRKCIHHLLIRQATV